MHVLLQRPGDILFHPDRSRSFSYRPYSDLPLSHVFSFSDGTGPVLIARSFERLWNVSWAGQSGRAQLLSDGRGRQFLVSYLPRVSFSSLPETKTTSSCNQEAHLNLLPDSVRLTFQAARSSKDKELQPPCMLRFGDCRLRDRHSIACHTCVRHAAARTPLSPLALASLPGHRSSSKV